MERKDHSLIEDEGAGYLVSVSDLMSGLLYVFIILLVGFLLTYTTNQSEPKVPAKLLEQAETERDDWKKRYEALLLKYEQFEKRYTQLRDNFEQLQTKHSVLVAKHSDLKESHLKLERKNKYLETLIERYLAEIAMLKKERNNLQLKIEELEKAVADRDREIADLKEQILTLKKSLDLLGGLTAEELSKIIKDLEWIKEYLIEYLEQLHTSSKNELLSSLSEAASEEGLLIDIVERTAIMRIPDVHFMGDMSVNWRSNYSSSKKAFAEVRKLGNTLYKVLPCFTGSANAFNCDPKTYGSLKLILVEGHVSPDDFNNFERAMEVSSRHSFTVYHDLLNEKKELRSLLNRDGEAIFSTSGYGFNRPISDQKGNYMHDVNRRVDLRFIMSTPMIPVEIIDQLKKIGVPADER